MWTDSNEKPVQQEKAQVAEYYLLSANFTKILPIWEID